MKKVLMTAALVLVASSAFAAITNSKHDFSSTGGSASYGVAGQTQICIFCHTPHNAKTNALLWNRNAGTATVTIYNKADSGTLNYTALPSIGTTSKLCLSCHDGTVAVDSFASNAGTAANVISSSANLSGSLVNDHPIAFKYSVAATADLDIVANGGTVNLPLFNNGTETGSMECATCHDVHAKQGVQAKFLRINNAGSNLCLNCHSK